MTIRSAILIFAAAVLPICGRVLYREHIVSVTAERERSMVPGTCMSSPLAVAVATDVEGSVVTRWMAEELGRDLHTIFLAVGLYALCVPFCHTLFP